MMRGVFYKTFFMRISEFLVHDAQIFVIFIPPAQHELARSEPEFFSVDQPKGEFGMLRINAVTATRSEAKNTNLGSLGLSIKENSRT